MTKTILITGSTDGIGLLAARKMASEGFHLLIHGRNQSKLDQTVSELSGLQGAPNIQGYCCDLSDLDSVVQLAERVKTEQPKIDVIINNAGVLKTSTPQTADGLDSRFVVNTLAPYLLTKLLLAVCPDSGRIINLSSAAQSSVDLAAMQHYEVMSDMEAYSQSKLAITMWSAHLASELGPDGPMVISVNPGSLLATNMVKEGFGIDGNDVNIGADILLRLALSDDPEIRTGRYYDNDAGRFGDPHVDALDRQKNAAVSNAVENLLRQKGLL